MLHFPLYLTAIFSQVYSLYGINASISITTTETTMVLQWPVPDITASYQVRYGVSSNSSDVNNASVTMPSINNTNVVHPITGLRPGELYQVEVFKDDVAVFQDFKATKPMPVENVQSSMETTTTMVISWSPYPTSVQDTYQVYVTGVTNSTFYLVSYNVTVTQHQIDGLAPSSYYKVEVLVYSHGEQGNKSQEVTVNTAPIQPVTVTVNAIDTQKLNISWAPHPTSQQDFFEISYLYNQTAGNEVEVNTTCNNTEVTWCELAMPGRPGQVYEIHVYSVLGSVASRGTMSLHSTVPLPVTDLQELMGNETTLHLSWTIPNNSYVRHFVIVVESKYGGLTRDIAADKQEVILTDLNIGTMYNVSIRTHSGYTVSAPVTGVFYTNPMPINSLSNSAVDATTNSLRVFWTMNETTTIDNLKIDINPKPSTGSFPLNLTTDVSNYTFTGLTAGQSYKITVITVLASKESEPVEASFNAAPLPPNDVVVNGTSSSAVTVHWQAPTGHVDKYRLTLTSQPGDVVEVITVETVVHEFLGLIAGTQYTVMVESQSGNLYSTSVTRSFTTDPNSVSEFSVNGTDTRTVNITWQAPENSSYDVFQLSIDPAHIDTPINVSKDTFSYSFQPLQPGVLYLISVSTVSLGVAGDSVSIRAVTDPLAVLDMAAVAYGTGLRTSWRVDPTSQQSGFLVWYHKNLSNSVMAQLPPVSMEANKYEYTVDIPDLHPGGQYKVKVQAWQNVSGESAASAVQEAVGTTRPKPVEGLTLELEGTDTLHVNWSAGTGSVQNHYVIRHRPSLVNPGAAWVENATFSTNLTLRGLYPGEKYDIEVYAVSGDVKSEAQTIAIVIAPLPVLGVEVLPARTTTDSITLQWTYNNSATYVESWIISYVTPENKNMSKTVPNTATGSTVQQLIDGLVAGYQYSVTVQSMVQNVTSAGKQALATTEPLNNIVLSFVEVPTNSSFVINYSLTESDFFDKIQFVLVDPKTEVVKQKQDVNKSVEFTSLVSGTSYTVEVQTVSHGEASEKKSINANTKPNAPSVSFTAKSTDITLVISQGPGGVDSYRVQCFSPTGTIVKDGDAQPESPDTQVLLHGLQPYTTYRVEVTAVFHVYESTTTVSITTSEASPSVVQNLRAIESAPLEVTLSWEKPKQENGAIVVYSVNYIGRKGSEQVEGSKNVSAPTTEYAFTDLRAGFIYTFYVRAVTVSAGESANVEIELKTYKPPYKEGIDEYKATPKPADPRLAPVGRNTIKFNFTNAFSEKYGEIIQYTVIVTEDKNSPDVSNYYILPGWKTARQDPSIKAYQVISNCSTFFESSSTCDGRFNIQKRAVNQVAFKVFEIGSESNCDNKIYCNGPLKPDTTYYITLRAYTTMQYKDTPFSEAVRTQAVPPSSEGGPNIGAIVGGVVAVVVAITVVFVVIIVRRRLGQKSTMYRHQPEHQLAHRSSLSQRKSCCPVTLSDFREHIRLMKADSDFRYAEQFEDLKDIGRGQLCTAAELPCNRGKNRFTNILPYDHSRVKLLPIDDEEGSDYINANYVPGFNSKREYIVSQGPLPATRDDFWRLIWEQNCRNIVMLTKCIEKGREKCDRYWPTGADAVFYGDLQVAALNETVFPDWTVSEFKLSLGDQSRQIRHFHFTSWPDFGVPKKEQILVRFVRMVREKLIKEGGPIVVHCSAGVGRSGTFVVLDRLLQRIKTHSTIDIFSTVAELRKERVWMVQTEQQYICIHNCLLCVLDGREDEHVYDNVGHSNIAFEDDEGVDLN